MAEFVAARMLTPEAAAFRPLTVQSMFRSYRTCPMYPDTNDATMSARLRALIGGWIFFGEIQGNCSASDPFCFLPVVDQNGEHCEVVMTAVDEFAVRKVREIFSSLPLQTTLFVALPTVKNINDKGRKIVAAESFISFCNVPLNMTDTLRLIAMYSSPLEIAGLAEAMDNSLVTIANRQGIVREIVRRRIGPSTKSSVKVGPPRSTLVLLLLTFLPSLADFGGCSDQGLTCYDG